LAAASKDRPEDLHLPTRNEFIPTRLDVEKLDIKEPAKKPKLLRNDDKMRLWWKKDDAFWVPKANVNVLLRNPLTYTSPATYVKSVLFTGLVKDALTSYSYDAEISGLFYSVAANMLGMDIAVHGYNDKLSVLLEKILLTIRDLEIRPDRFDIIKERMTRKYKNWDYQQPYYQIGDFTRWLLNEKAWMTHQYALELPHITLEDVRAFAPQLIQQAHIEIMAHGNLYRDEAKKIGTLIESTLKPRALPPSQWQLRRNVIIAPGSNYVFKKTLGDADNVNHCIEYYLQVGHVMDSKLRARLQLFAQMTEEPAFDQLRTKEQLGYVVWSGVRPAATTMGYRVLIQSERNPEYLETRINAFLTKMKAHITDMSSEEFEGHKRSLITKRLEKLKNLESETGRLWGYINGEYFDFDRVDTDVAEIRTLTQVDTHAFYDKYIDPQSATRAKVAIHLIAQAEDVSADDPVTQFLQLMEKVLASVGIEVDEERLSKQFEGVEVSSKEAVIAKAKSYVTTSVRVEDSEAAIQQVEKAIPQILAALKTKSQTVETNGVHASEVAEAVVIEDVHRWKAGLQISEGPVAITELKEFEDLEAKL
jgi:insulysin